jgi:hypothetical protein
MVEATLKEYTQHIGVCLMATYFLPSADADQCSCMLLSMILFLFVEEMGVSLIMMDQIF